MSVCFKKQTTKALKIVKISDILFFRAKSKKKFWVGDFREKNFGSVGLPEPRTFFFGHTIFNVRRCYFLCQFVPVFFLPFRSQAAQEAKKKEKYVVSGQAVIFLTKHKISHYLVNIFIFKRAKQWSFTVFLKITFQNFLQRWGSYHSERND